MSEPFEKARQSPRPNSSRPGPWLQLFNPRGFEWNTYTLPIEHLPPALDGLRIVHITDIHVRKKWLSVYDDVIARLRDDPPDLVMLSGDILEHRMDHRDALPTMRRFIGALNSRLGTFAILGNHDGDLLAPEFAPLGVTLVKGQLARLSESGRDGETSIDIIGVPGIVRDDVRGGCLTKFPPRENNSLRIVMSHFPDTIREIVAMGIAPDIILAGHTHGGQVCLPGQIALIKHDTLPRPHYIGVHRFGKTWLVIPRGLGFATYPIRLFCPAEIIELTLRRTDETAKHFVTSQNS